jgi:hypothetical protein
MGAGDRIKSWLRRDEGAGASSGTDLPAFPVPAPHPPPDAAQDAPQAEQPGTDEAAPSQRASGDEQAAAEHLSESLPLAQDQELLGPCRDCDGYWTRLKVRGQKPLTCPACKQAA